VIQIYTDGACLGNPGPGGYGVVILTGTERQELSGTVRLTTNNRMELLAVIEGLRHVLRHVLGKEADLPLQVFSDSKYVVDAVSQGWAQRWQANGWRRNRREKALNPDLWAELLGLLVDQPVTFHWVRGHAGHPENERCDALAVQAAVFAQRHPEQARHL